MNEIKNDFDERLNKKNKFLTINPLHFSSDFFYIIYKDQYKKQINYRFFALEK